MAGSLAASAASAQMQEDLGVGSLPPISRDYKTKIVGWAKGFYAEARALGPAVVSDPVLIRDRTGRLLWLVCVEVANDGAFVRRPGPERFAFGFAPNYFSAPQARLGSTLIRSDCDERALAWRPFRELSRL